MNIDDLINVRISADTTTATRQGFGTPMFAGYHTVWSDLVRAVSAASEMIDAGFDADDPLVRMVQAAKSQNPTIRQIKIGRLTTAVADTKKITITSAVEGEHVKLTITGPNGTATAIDYTIGADETTTTVATAVELLVEAVSGIASTSSGANITAVGSPTGATFYYSGLVNCTLLDQTPDASVDDDLDDILLADPDWYGLACVYESEVNADKIATWAEANKKWYVAHSADDAEIDGTGQMGQGWKDASLGRTSGVWSRDTIHYPAAALIAVMGAKDPGSTSATFKRLRTVAVDTLTTAQTNALLADNWNYYITVAGKNVFFPGKVASGEWIDVVIGLDWLRTEMQASVFDAISTPDKVDYDAAGISLVAGVMRGVLAQAVARRILDPGDGDEIQAPTVTAPRIADIPVEARAGRRLPDMKFSGRLRGAIVYVDPIDGTLSV